MVRKIVLSLIAVLVLGAYAFAQNKQVSGTVSDANGESGCGRYCHGRRYFDRYYDQRWQAQYSTFGSG